MPDWFSQNAPKTSSGGDWFESNAPRHRPVSAEDFIEDKTPEGSALGRFASGVWESVNPVTAVKGIAHAVAHPIDTAGGMVGAQMAEFSKAKELAKQGRYVEAAGHGAAGVVPLLGPAAAAAGEQIASGDVAGGLGKGVGLVAPVAIGALAPKSVGVRGAAAAPQTAEALAYAERTGIPLDVAAATDNRFLQAAQHVADRSLAGSLVASKAAKVQAERLATVGEQLAAKAHPTAVSALEAGEAAQKGVRGVVGTQRAAANTAYDRLRSLEGQQAQHVPMAVDISETKAAMRPIYDKLAAESKLVPFMSGSGKGRAFVALDRIMNGPDVAPLSVADSALSELKSMARSNDPHLRNVGQGIAAKAVDNLHRAVGEAAERAGPQAVTALEEGRIATKAKYAAAEVLKRLEGKQQTKSGTTAFRGLTQSADTSVKALKDVLTQAPETKPLVARAVLDGLLDHPTAGPAKTWADWQKIGPYTKSLLFEPSHVKDLDNFFLLRKRMAGNSNPSGTAHTLLTATQAGHIMLNPLSGAAAQLSAAAISKLLHSQAGVRLLTRGMTIPVRNAAARTAWLSELAAATSPSESQTTPAPAIAR